MQIHKSITGWRNQQGGPTYQWEAFPDLEGVCVDAEVSMIWQSDVLSHSDMVVLNQPPSWAGKTEGGNCSVFIKEVTGQEVKAPRVRCRITWELVMPPIVFIDPVKSQPGQFEWWTRGFSRNSALCTFQVILNLDDGTGGFFNELQRYMNHYQNVTHRVIINNHRSTTPTAGEPYMGIQYNGCEMFPVVLMCGDEDFDVYDVAPTGLYAGMVRPTIFGYKMGALYGKIPGSRGSTRCWLGSGQSPIYSNNPIDLDNPTWAHYDSSPHRRLTLTFPLKAGAGGSSAEVMNGWTPTGSEFTLPHHLGYAISFSIDAGPFPTR